MYRDWLLYPFPHLVINLLCILLEETVLLLLLIIVFTYLESLFLVYILNTGRCLLVAIKRQTGGVFFFPILIMIRSVILSLA